MIENGCKQSGQNCVRCIPLHVTSDVRKLCRIAEQLWTQQHSFNPVSCTRTCNTASIIANDIYPANVRLTRPQKLNHKTVHPQNNDRKYHTKMTPTTRHHLYPPFPAELPTAPLVSVSLAKLEASDGAESKAFFDACRNLGFFYLDTLGSPLGSSLVTEAEQLNDLQARFFKLPDQEKEEYAREKVDPFFGYRHGDLGTCHDDGSPKRNESYNVSSLPRLKQQSYRWAYFPPFRCAKTTSRATAMHCLILA